MTNANQLTREIHTAMHPKAVLIAYTTEQSRVHFLELRSIGPDGKMGEGMPVTVEFINELVRNYSGVHDGTPHGQVPANLLYCDTRKGNERYVWYNPPRKRLMYFVEKLNIENAEYHVPGVIYEASERGLNIYAYKDAVPSPETQLFAAPFFNVSGASVCIGNARIEKPRLPTFTSFLEYWEKKFWLTEFSHLGSRGNPTVSNLVTVTKSARCAPFDTNELKPLDNLRLKDLLK